MSAFAQFAHAPRADDLNFKDESNPNLVTGRELADIYLGYIKKYPIVRARSRAALSGARG